MKFWRSALAVVTAGLLSLSASAQQPLALSPLPIESLSRLPAITGVTMSPDGKHVAALVAAPGQRWPVISVWEVDNLAKPPTTIASREMRPRNVQFVGNDRLLFTADQPVNSGSCKAYTVQTIVTDFTGSNFSQPFGGQLENDDLSKYACGIRLGGSDTGVVIAGTIDDPNRYIVTQQNASNGAVTVSALDVTRMRVSQIARLGDDEGFLVADIRTGQPMVKETLLSVGGAFRSERQVRNRQSGAWETHPELQVLFRDRVAMNPLGFFDPNDPNKLYVATNRGTNFTQIRIYDIATRTWEAQPAYSSPEFDVAGIRPLIDRANKKLLGPGSITVDGPYQREIFNDDYWAPLQRTLEAQFPGQQVDFGTLNRESGRAIIVVSSPRHSPAYYILLNGRELKLLGRERPWISAQQLSETTFTRFAARDGLQIPAFITLPPGYNKATHGRIPVVVHPHGGPWARDYLGWDSSGWTQFMATRGYAVIQPQYRGSDGWGMQLWKAGDAEWGQKMSDDNDDAAAYLVKEGIGDSSRMAIFGYSYGGFAAIAASVRPNSPYRCALSGAGVADLGRLSNLWGASRIAREYQGWTVAGMNPMANVRNANIPILLYHGERDRQADTLHSREFNSAMRGAGKNVQYVEIKDMWHQLPWWPEWHTQSLNLINDWLAGPNCFGGAAPTRT